MKNVLVASMSLFLVNPLVSLAQSYSEYDSLIQRAVNAYYEKNYEESGKMYDKAFTMNYATDEEFYNAACSWSLAKNKDKSIQYLDSAFEYGYSSFNWLKRDRDLDFVRDDRRFQTKFNEYQEYLNKDRILNYEVIIKDLVESERKVLVYYRDSINDKCDNCPQWAGESLTDFVESSGLNIKERYIDSILNFQNKSIKFIDCRGDLNLSFLKLNRLVVSNRNNRLENFRIYRLSLRSSAFNTRFKFGWIWDTDFGLCNHIIFNGFHEFRFSSNIGFFRGLYYNSKRDRFDPNTYRIIADRNANNKTIVDIGYSKFKLNKRIVNSWESLHIPLEVEADEFSFTYNEVDSEFSFESSKFNNVAYIAKNEFKYPVDISLVNFPEFNTYMPYHQFQNGLGISRFSDKVSTYEAEEDTIRLDFFVGNFEELYKTEGFDMLVKSYHWLYNNSRLKGDIYSANSAYTEMKDLLLKKDRYIHEQSGTSSTLIRYQLNRLMKVYTDHGTNPSKAILIAFYIILGFSVLYLFFPSEWDKKSKARLIQDYRMFIKKNSHGYVKPFFIMLWGIIISIINAVMLSLNAFVTLGFGTIPTRGFAKYLCVIQGFIGWFLLSIFLVALINQVLV